MTSIRTLNMVWERKTRGSYAVSRFALDDAGTVALAMPRPLAARTYDLTRFSIDGGEEVRATFSVETLLEIEASAKSDSVIGMTSDDVYLLNNGVKTRFLPDRRIILVDSALSSDGRTVAAGFSDLAGSSFALAVGEITGEVAWLRESEGHISAVAISPDGGSIVQGEESGAITLLDRSRRERWIFLQDEPVLALACAPRGQFTVFGTCAGSVSLVDAEGSRRWEARLPGEIVSLGLSADGGACAALVRRVPEDGTTRLFVLDSSGQIGWDHEYEKRVVGLAISPSGQYLAASGRDGTHTLYEVVFGQAGGGGRSAESLADTMRRTASIEAEQDWAEAVKLLCAALDELPSEVAACERLFAIREAKTESLLKQARLCCDCADYVEALKSLNALREIAPEEPELYVLLNEVRTRWSQHEVMRADALLDQADYTGAAQALNGILQFAPHCLEARRRLAGLDVLRAKDADTEAERLLAAGEQAAGLDALERAQQIIALPHRAEKIRRVQVDVEYQAGLKAYEEKRYREAVFQFKKVLARDPDHADARRHLNFAQRFEQDSNEALNDRFGRLE